MLWVVWGGNISTNLSPGEHLLVILLPRVDVPTAIPEVGVFVYWRRGVGHHVSRVLASVHVWVSGLVNVGPGGGFDLANNKCQHY